MAQNLWANWPFGGVGATTQEQALSGDVSQWLRVFSPTVTVNGSGNPGLEGEIVRDVATYGAQLGQISAIVLALAKGNKDVPGEAVTKLQKIVTEVDKKKDEYQHNAAARARKALEDLQKHDPAAFATVLSEFRPGGSDPAVPPAGVPVEALSRSPA
jgi:hypothetical protein